MKKFRRSKRAGASCTAALSGSKLYAGDGTVAISAEPVFDALSTKTTRTIGVPLRAAN